MKYLDKIIAIMVNLINQYAKWIAFMIVLSTALRIATGLLGVINKGIGYIVNMGKK